jgi:transposase-like protein
MVFRNRGTGHTGGRAQDDLPGRHGEKALAALESFSQGPWGKKYPPIALIWKRQWEQVTPFFSYPAEVRKIIYTTNTIESLHMQLRKIIKNRGHSPMTMLPSSCSIWR